MAMSRSNNNRNWSASVEAGPIRLDKWLHDNLSGYSRVRVRELIGGGRVRVNGKRAKKGDHVDAGDVIEVQSLLAAEGPPAEPSLELPVRFEDDELLVVEKPWGMPTHPLSPEETGTVVNFALAHVPGLRGAGGKALEPGLVHRLDAGTQGLVLLAKTAESFEFMRHEFKMRRVKKIYRALVRGEPKRKGGEITVPLGRHPSRPGLMVAAEPGVKLRGRPLDALTRYRRLESEGGVSLLELELVTGHMHQLRVHLAWLGHPLLGDDRYGDHADPGSRSFALQSSQLSFIHPRNRGRVTVSVEQFLDLAAAGRFDPAIRR